VQRIRLNQHPLQIEGAQELLEGRPLVARSGVIGGLGDRHPQLAGVERHLGDESRGAIGSIRLAGGTPHGLAITDQLIEIPVLISDLGQHPLAQQGEQPVQIHPLEQVEEGGVAGCTAQLQIQGLAERLAVPAGKALQIPGAAAVAQDPQNRHQQQQPLGIADPAALTAFRQGLQKADQIGGRSGLEQGSGAVLPTKPGPDRPGNGTWDALSVGPVVLGGGGRRCRSPPPRESRLLYFCSGLAAGAHRGWRLMESSPIR